MSAMPKSNPSYHPTTLPLDDAGYQQALWDEGLALPAECYNYSLAESPPLEDYHTSTADNSRTTTTRRSRGRGSDQGTPPDSTSPRQATKGQRRWRNPKPEQIERRRQQNRQSQKNFRERKDKYISQLEAQLEETSRQNEQLEQMIQDLQTQSQNHTPSPPFLSAAVTTTMNQGGFPVDMVQTGTAFDNYLEEPLWSSADSIPIDPDVDMAGMGTETSLGLDSLGQSYMW